MTNEDEKKPEATEVGIKPSVVGANEVPITERQAAGVLAGVEKGGEEEKIKEALKKRFLLLAEDDPRLESLLDEFKSVGGEQMVQAKTLDGVRKETDDFISRVEQGGLDQTILTMIADLEYPKVRGGVPSSNNGIEGIKYVREAVDTYNLAHPDKPLRVEVILNSTREDMAGRVSADAVSHDKKEAVRKLLEMVSNK